MKLAFVLVGCHNIEWFEVGLTSFGIHFPEHTEHLFVVDANPANQRAEWRVECDKESAQLRRMFGNQEHFLTLHAIPDDPIYFWSSSHGLAVDLAAEAATKRGYTHLMLFEPNCLILGRNWLVKLVSGVNSGHSAVGMEVRNYGPLDPCGSIWNLPAAVSFAGIRKTDLHKADPLYSQSVDCSPLNDEDADFVTNWWDTGQLAWFDAIH